MEKFHLHKRGIHSSVLINIPGYILHWNDFDSYTNFELNIFLDDNVIIFDKSFALYL